MSAADIFGHLVTHLTIFSLARESRSAIQSIGIPLVINILELSHHFLFLYGKRQESLVRLPEGPKESTATSKCTGLR